MWQLLILLTFYRWIMDFSVPWTHWSLKSAVFAATTKCKYVDVLSYPDHNTSIDEGDLNGDAAVLQWTVKVLKEICHFYQGAQLIGHDRIYINSFSQLPLEVCGFCVPPCFHLRMALLLTIKVRFMSLRTYRQKWHSTDDLYPLSGTLSTLEHSKAVWEMHCTQSPSIFQIRPWVCSFFAHFM